MSRNLLGGISDFWGLFSMIGYCDEGTICNDRRRPLQNSAGDLGGTISPPVGPGQSPGGGPGGKAPGSSKDPKVYITKRGQELTRMVHF